MNLQVGTSGASEDQIKIIHKGKSFDIEPELSRVYKEKLVKNLQFTVQHKIEKSEFAVEDQNRIARINWNGKVNKLTASKFLSLTLDAIEYHSYNKILVDLSGLMELDTEARIIVKEALKVRAKDLTRKTRKIAFINSRSNKGNIFGNMIKLVFEMHLNKSEIQDYDTAEDAISWLVSKG